MIDLRSSECLVQFGVTFAALAGLQMAFIMLREIDPTWLKKEHPSLWKPIASFDARGLATIRCFERTRLNGMRVIRGFRLAKISSFSSPSAQSLLFSTPHPQAMSFFPCNFPASHSPAEIGLRIQVSSSKGTSLLHKEASSTEVQAWHQTGSSRQEGLLFSH